MYAPPQSVVVLLSLGAGEYQSYIREAATGLLDILDVFSSCQPTLECLLGELFCCGA